MYFNGLIWFLGEMDVKYFPFNAKINKKSVTFAQIMKKMIEINLS